MAGHSPSVPCLFYRKWILLPAPRSARCSSPLCRLVLFLSKLLYPTETLRGAWPVPCVAFKSPIQQIYQPVSLFCCCRVHLLPPKVGSFPENSGSVLEHANEELFSRWCVMATMSVWQNVVAVRELAVMNHQSVRSQYVLICLSQSELSSRLYTHSTTAWLSCDFI